MNVSVGLLTPAAPLADTSPFGAPLVRGLAQHGYRQDHNLTFERRGAEGHVDQLPHLVADLAASHVDVIVAIGYPAALAIKHGTTLPAVISGAGDPVGTGLNHVYFEKRSFSSSGLRQSLTQRRSASAHGSWLMRTSKSATRRVRSSALAWQ